MLINIPFSWLLFLFQIPSMCSPLVAGTSESDQLDRIFRLLGTPSALSYPGIVNLPEYTPDLPQYPPPQGGGIASLVPTLDAHGVNLLEQMLQYDPSRRIAAETALNHPFFADINGTTAGVPNGAGGKSGAGTTGTP